MKRALLCATAAATMVSAGAVAHAQSGWYGTAKIGAIVDGIQDVDAKNPVVGGMIDTNATPQSDLVYGAGLGFGFDSGLRLEGVFEYRNVELEVPDTFLGLQPLGTSGPDGAGSTRVTDLMFNVIQDFKSEARRSRRISASVSALLASTAAFRRSTRPVRLRPTALTTAALATRTTRLPASASS